MVTLETQLKKGTFGDTRKSFDKVVSEYFLTGVDNDPKSLQGARPTLKRFLNANDNDVDKARAQFIQAIQWREETRLLNADGFPREPLTCADLAVINRYNTKEWLGMDKTGERLVYYEHLGNLNVSALLKGLGNKDSAIGAKKYIKYCTLHMEYQQRLFADRGCTKTFVIYDLDGLRLFPNLTSIAKMVIQEISTIGNTYFPESVGKLYIINAPSAFQWCWDHVISKFFDPATKAKVQCIAGSNTLSTLNTDIGGTDVTFEFTNGRICATGKDYKSGFESWCCGRTSEDGHRARSRENEDGRPSGESSSLMEICTLVVGLFKGVSTQATDRESISNLYNDAKSRLMSSARSISP